MRMILRHAIISLAVVISMITCPQVSLACSCERQKVLEDITMAAPLIFKGEVVKSDILPRDVSPIWYGDATPVRTSFQIKSVLRGNPSNVEDIYSHGWPSSCSIDFPKMVGRSLVIAAYEVDGKLFTSFCSFWHLNRGLKY